MNAGMPLGMAMAEYFLRRNAWVSAIHPRVRRILCFVFLGSYIKVIPNPALGISPGKDSVLPL